MSEQSINEPQQLINRRKTLKGIASLAIVGLATACGGGGMNVTTDTSDDSNGDTSNNSGDNSTDSNTDNSSNTESPIELVTDWATGGTSAITDNFPDDSLFETATACAVSLTGAQTEGPCYFTGDYQEDISAGQTGLPMMLCLQLINQNCEPLANYEIEVWHCDVAGIYSGDTSSSADASSFNSSFCTGNDSKALASTWFRGTLVTDSSGRVNFATCFPGWYPSRAIHVHFRVKNNNNDELISQFGFADDFSQYLCTNHSEYVSNGSPDTSNTTDTVFGSDYEDYLFDVQQNSDGSLLAYKRIIIS